MDWFSISLFIEVEPHIGIFIVGGEDGEVYYSLEDIRYEEDLLKSLKSYRHTDRDCFRHDPAMDSALSSDFPEGRYSDGLMAFLSTFQGLFARYSQKSSTVILFKVPSNRRLNT